MEAPKSWDDVLGTAHMNDYRIEAGSKAEWAERAMMAEARVKELDHCLGELLAVIHRDGGHYLAENGPERSTKDAIQAWADLMAQADTIEALQQELREAREALRDLAAEARSACDAARYGSLIDALAAADAILAKSQ